jgi:hypothetical protein
VRPKTTSFIPRMHDAMNWPHGSAGRPTRYSDGAG